jgi:cell wall-associated NlpC family hydrolase
MISRLLRVTLIGAAALAVGLGTATHAHAAPTPAEIEQQIEAQWQILEPVIEEYNGITLELKTTRAKADELQKQLEPLQLAVDVAMVRVNALAVQAYKGGKMAALNAILTTGSPTGLADQLSRLDVLARNQQAQVSDVAVARNKYAADKRVLDGLIAQLTAREAELAAKKREIEAQIANLEKLQRQAYGTVGNGGGDLKPGECPGGGAVSAAADKAARTACAQIGKYYRFAAEGPDMFDCSGLTLYAWKAAGRSLPHNAKAQFGVTKRISGLEARPGDLVFFYPPGISHIGIVVGGGYMVHASRAGQPVKMVKIAGHGTIAGYGRV